ncbi:hypothetical protein ACOSP7_018023 [Xanthoceras sorbifolium]
MKLEIAPKMSMKALHSHLHRMRLFIQVGCKRNNHSPNPMQMVLLAKAMKVVIVDWVMNSWRLVCFRWVYVYMGV